MVLEETPRSRRLSGLEDMIETQTNHSILDKISNWYFEPKPFEKDGKIYEKLGIKKFKKQLLKATRHLGRRRENELSGTNYFIGSNLSAVSIKRFENETRRNEIVHTLFSLPTSYMAIASFSNEHYLLSVALATVVLPHLYAVGLQRYNRARAYSILEKITERETKNNNLN